MRPAPPPGLAPGPWRRAAADLRAAPAVYGFTTAQHPNGGPLDLRPGSPTADYPSVATAFGLPSAEVARCSQTHGVELLDATKGGVIGEADALFTTRPGLLLCVRTADCTPIVLLGPGVAAVVHAGWRGAAAGIVPEVLCHLRALGLAVSEAVIGPSICIDCYEVGDEVVASLRATGTPDARFLRELPNRRSHVDVAAVTAWQLEQGGVRSVQRLADCSRCDRALHSHRRDGAASGRMGAFVALLPE